MAALGWPDTVTCSCCGDETPAVHAIMGFDETWACPGCIAWHTD